MRQDWAAWRWWERVLFVAIMLSFASACLIGPIVFLVVG